LKNGIKYNLKFIYFLVTVGCEYLVFLAKKDEGEQFKKKDKIQNKKYEGIPH